MKKRSAWAARPTTTWKPSCRPQPYSGRFRGLLHAGLFVFLAGHLLGAHPTEARAQDQGANTLQTLAYVTLVRADQARDAGQWAAAGKLYRKALEHYRKVAAERPDWHPRIVAFRRDYCADQIKEMDRQLAAQPAAAPAPARPAPKPAPPQQMTDEKLKARVLAVQVENQYLRDLIDELESNQEAGSDFADFKEEFEALQEENLQLQEEVDRLREMPSAPKESEDLSALKAKIEELAADNKELARQLEKQDGKGARKLRKEAKELRKDNEILAEQLDAADKAIAKMRPASDVEKLQEENKALRKSIELAREKGSTASKKEMKALAKENATLRKQVAVSLAETDKLLENATRWETVIGEIGSVRQENERLREEVEAARGQIPALDRMQAVLKKTEDDLRLRNDEFAALKETAAQQAAALERAQSTGSDEVKSLRKELSKAQKELAKRDKDLARMKENDASGKVRALEKEKAGLQKDLDRERDESEALRETVKDLKKDSGRTADLANEIKALRKEKESLAEALEDAQSAMTRLAAEATETAAPAGKPGDLPPSETAEASPPQIELRTAPPPRQAAIDPALERRLKTGYRMEGRGEFEDALSLYNQILDEAPEFGNALKAKGRCLLHMGETREALKVLNRGKTLMPGDGPLMLLLGIAYYHTEQYESSAGELSALIIQEPDNARAHNALGAAWMALDQLDNAQTAFESAVELNPQLADAHYNLAQILRGGTAEDLAVAREHYQKARELGTPADPDLEAALAE